MTPLGCAFFEPYSICHQVQLAGILCYTGGSEENQGVFRQWGEVAYDNSGNNTGTGRGDL